MDTLENPHKILSFCIPCTWYNVVWIVSAIATYEACLWNQISFKLEYQIIIIRVYAIKSDNYFASLSVCAIQQQVGYYSLFARTH